MIPLYLIKKYFEANFEFRSNLGINKCPLNKFPLLYQERLTRQSKKLEIFRGCNS